MLSHDYIKTKVVSLLPIDSELYSDQLDLIIDGAIAKLEAEGVPNLFTESSAEGMNYILCVSYQCVMDLDLDVDLDRMTKQYISRVNTLRMTL